MNYNNPTEAANEFRMAAINKLTKSFPQLALMGILGGIFISFGGLLSVTVAGGMTEAAMSNPGIVKFIAGALFPIGLIMVALTGADLFTSNCASYTFPLLNKEINLTKFFVALLLSYIFNFIGAQFIAHTMSANLGMLDGEPWRSYLINYSDAKINQDFITVFVKGIGANWLVCLGMYMGYTAKDVPGKAIGIWIPVMLFVTLGYEHSIANMFFIPAAIYIGADITWLAFITKNLIPATLGNIVGGSVFVGAVYWYLFLKKRNNAT